MDAWHGVDKHGIIFFRGSDGLTLKSSYHALSQELPVWNTKLKKKLEKNKNKKNTIGSKMLLINTF